MELITEGLEPAELAHRTAVLLGIRHHGSLLEWEPLPKAFNIYKSYMSVEPRMDTFQVEGERVRVVAGMLSIPPTKVRDGLKNYIAFQQLVKSSAGVDDKHFSLIEAMTSNRQLNVHDVIQRDANTFALSDQSIQNIEQVCQFSTRDSLSPAKKILAQPQSVAMLGKLKEKAAAADSEAVRAFARRKYEEATSGEIDPESGNLKVSVESALDSVVNLESQTKWLETLDALMNQMEKELNKADFRSQGNDRLFLDMARRALVPLRRIIGISE